MKLKREFAAREVAGEYLLVPIGRTTVDMNGMITLNETGAFLWQKLPDAPDEAALVDALLAEYEVESVSAQQDVAEFLMQLRELGIL